MFCSLCGCIHWVEQVFNVAIVPVVSSANVASFSFLAAKAWRFKHGMCRLFSCFGCNYRISRVEDTLEWDVMHLCAGLASHGRHYSLSMS